MDNQDKIYKNLEVNRKRIEEVFGVPKNFDFIIRDFEIETDKTPIKGFMIFYDGLVDVDLINRDILRSFTKNIGSIPKNEGLEDFILKRIINLGPLSVEKNFSTAISGVSFGNSLIFIDGCEACLVADVKGWGNRGVDQPIREASLSGPQEAFNESVMNNLALVRKILKDPDLMAENIKVGTKSNTTCAMLYIRGVTNNELICEVKRRLELIETEYIFSSSDIEMLLETKTFMPMTRVLKTERPDRAASMLAEGKIVVIVQGSPFALVLPTTAVDLIEASEDNYVRVTEANFMKLVRLIGLSLSLLLPGSFIAVMMYHREIVPSDLLLAVEASREVVPFPLVIELIMMEIAFELIKEASIRVPSPVGSSLGIIGGLILGQAAVDANIVSPISIIIVSIAGLGAFTAPTVALSRSLSVLRFAFIVFGAVGGMLGIVFVFFVGTAIFASSVSFGVPFLSPITPKDGTSTMDVVLVKPIWKKERRPKNLNTQNPVRQPHISRKWME